MVSPQSILGTTSITTHQRILKLQPTLRSTPLPPPLLFFFQPSPILVAIVPSDCRQSPLGILHLIGIGLAKSKTPTPAGSFGRGRGDEDTNHSGIVRGRIKRRGKTSHRRSARRFIRAAKLKIPIVGCNENFGYQGWESGGGGRCLTGSENPS